MRAIGINDYLAICDVKRGSYDARQTLKEIGLAFGLARRLAGGVMLDLDCICHFISEALTPVLSRKYAAAIVRAYSDEILKAVGLADANPAEVMFLAGVEFGPGYGQITREHDRKMRFGATTLTDFAASFAKSPEANDVTRVTHINVTEILRNVRARAAKRGFDWTAPFFPPPSDPMAAKLIATAKKERESALRLYAQDQLAKSAPAIETRQ